MNIDVHMKSRITAWVLVVVVAASTCVVPTMSRAENAAPETSVSAPWDVTVTVKMIGPVTQTTDLQIICLLKHNPAGDHYIEAMQDFNEKLGGVLSSLRERGEFVGDPGERSEEHTSELQSLAYLVCRLLLEKKKIVS